ncbi:thiamine-phosphate kinase, partial [Bradyrhizobium sp. Arg68]|nr:thiamine-phosphate kinase [Bradyrhizobium ivorense]
LCAVPGDRVDGFLREAKQAGVAVTAIGGLIAGTSPPSFLDAHGRELALKRLSYSHF